MQRFGRNIDLSERLMRIKRLTLDKSTLRPNRCIFFNFFWTEFTHSSSPSKLKELFRKIFIGIVAISIYPGEITFIQHLERALEQNQVPWKKKNIVSEEKGHFVQIERDTLIFSRQRAE